MVTEKNNNKKTKLVAMYGNQVSNGITTNLGNSLVPYLATYVGFTVGEMGILQAVTNLFPNLFQRIWGRISDKYNNEILLIIIGGIVNAITFTLLLVFNTPWIFIMIISIGMIIGSMSIPAWGTIIGKYIKQKEHYHFVSQIILYSNIVGVLSIIGFTIYSYYDVSTNVNHLILPFTIATSAGIVGSIFMLLLYGDSNKKKDANNKPEYRNDYKNSGGYGVKSIFSESSEMKYLITSQLICTLGMSISWPLFYITTVTVLKANYLDIGIINLVSIISLIISIPFMERAIYRFGMRKLIILSRFIFIPLPLFYAFATNLIPIYLINGLIGPAQAISAVVFFVYIVKISPVNKKAEYWGTFNFVVGIATFAGSIIGGFLSESLIPFMGLVTAFMLVYLLSTAIRFAGAVYSFKIKEVPIEKKEPAKSYITDSLRRYYYRIRWFKRV